MRPVVVCHSSIKAGGEAYLNRLYACLAERSHEPVLVGQIPGWEMCQLPRIPVQLSPKWSSRYVFSGAVRLPRENVRVRRAVRGLQADLFHLQYKREQIGFTRSLASQAPVVWTEHGRFFPGWKGSVLAAGYRAAARYVQVIICVSQEVAADVRSVVGARPRIEVVENSVDTAVHRPPTGSERALAKKHLNLADGLPVLLWLGRLDEGKRPLFAVELAAKWPGATIIAGDGGLREQVETSARELKNTQVLGFVNNVSVLYWAADVMAFTSTGAGEGYPTTTLVEAGAHGVPVVGDESSGAARALMDMGVEPLPASADAAQWVEALLSARTPSRSGEVRRWAEQHDVRQWADAHEGILRSVVATRRRS